MSCVLAAEIVCRVNNHEFEEFTVQYEAADIEIPDFMHHEDLSFSDFSLLQNHEKGLLNSQLTVLKDFIVSEKFDFVEVTPSYEYRTETPTLNAMVMKQQMTYTWTASIFFKECSLF